MFSDADVEPIGLLYSKVNAAVYINIIDQQIIPSLSTYLVIRAIFM